MYCSRCNSSERVKDGKAHGRQRYQCKSCGFRYTVMSRSRSKPLLMKRQALELYLEGLGFRSIGRFLGVSHVSVYHWIKSFGSQIETIKSSQAPEIVEIDEMHSYIGSKKTTSGSGLLLIAMGSDLSISSLVIDRLIQEKSFGKN